MEHQSGKLIKPGAIRALLKLGCPANKIKWYRGVQGWQMLGLRVNK